LHNAAPAVLVLIVGQGACLGRQDAHTPLAINSMAAAFNLAGDLIFTLWLGWYEVTSGFSPSDL
jgi:Na+-driven multidrug efflux pump